jgi:uncharacterized membrane protein YphA (DoxX/SURF4 family)
LIAKVIKFAQNKQQQMKTTKIFYWILTAIVALMMAFSCYSYLTKPEMAAAFHHLGFPDYFRIELAIAKLIGAVVLLAPVGARLKEWAYAGFTIVFVSAFIAHTVSGDPVANRIMPLVFLGILGGSYFLYYKKQQ